jgi:GTP-binding protein
VQFLDEFECTVRGGKGGDGCCSFRREKYVPRGGPDGGDGGDGGSVVLLATTHENTLYHLAGTRVYAARKGQPGGTSECTGASGDDLVLRLPVGTVVLDAERGHTLKDLTANGETFVVARGGRGGRGNVRFASATNRTPRQCESGHPGEERRVRLSLKLIADVGLVGLPNAGKSTLLSTLSAARPKIADYPFTTLEPCLGIVVLPDESTCVMADIPGLIEGAHRGKGLGDQFLKHIERTRVLLQLVDCSAMADQEPYAAYEVISQELRGYSGDLASRPKLVVATKVEDDESRRRAQDLSEKLSSGASGDEPATVLAVSAATHAGLRSLLDALLPFARRESH